MNLSEAFVVQVLNRKGCRVMWASTTLLMAASLIVGQPKLTSTVNAKRSAESRRQSVIRIATQIRRADYEGDRSKLVRLYEDLEPFANNKQFGAKVRYWRGFALWRRALNGFNDSVDRVEIEQDLKQAVSEFEAR